MQRSWTTAHAAPARQFDHWREMICEAFLDLAPESPLRGRFRGVVEQRAAGPFTLARIESQAQIVQRRWREISRSPRDSYYVNIQVRGRGAVGQDGRVAVLRPGDFALVDTMRPFRMTFDGDFVQLSLHVPSRLLLAELSAPPVTATRVPGSSAVATALRSALVAVARGEVTDEAAARLAVHAGGLLAVALDHPCPAGAPRDDRHRHLVDRALADMNTHLTDPALGPGSAAPRLGVSVRALHQAFAGRDRSYSREVTRRRLLRAHRMLTDPAHRHWRVVDVATDCGFADVTHFHRAFRQTFGCTPGEVRPNA